LLIAVSAFASSAGLAQQAGTAQRAELTALDYFEIQQLVARYARAIDTCSNNGYDYADLFTPDGAFVAMINGKPAAVIECRERLAEVSGEGTRGCENVPWIEEGARHLYANHIVTPAAEGASGGVDMLTIGLGGDPNKFEYDGYCEGTYVRTPDGWRFKRRVHHALLRAGERVEPAAGERQ